MIKSRLGAEHYNAYLGRNVKGIYRSFFFDSNNEFSSTQLIQMLTWYMSKGILAGNRIEAINSTADSISAADKENMYRLVREATTIVSMSIAILVLKGMASADDDDELDDFNLDGTLNLTADEKREKKRKAKYEHDLWGFKGFGTINFWLDALCRVQSEMSSVFDVSVIGDIFINPKQNYTLLVKTMFNMADTVHAFWNTFLGDGKGVKQITGMHAFKDLGHTFDFIRNPDLLTQGKPDDAWIVSGIPVLNQFFGPNSPPAYMSKKLPKREALEQIWKNTKDMWDDIREGVGLPAEVPHGPKDTKQNVRMVARVVRVLDGDTFVIDHDGEEMTIRLPFTDSPEIAHEGWLSWLLPNAPYGIEATNYLRSRIEGQEIELLKYKKKDSMGRGLWDVMLEGDVSISEEMLTLGLAVPYGSEGRTLPRADVLAELAKANRVGVWSSSMPIRPLDWKHSNFYTNYWNKMLEAIGSQ
jgi:endonuclease YncB( thermonuclease family)